MTSTIGDRWISDVLMREWISGFVDGACLGIFFVLAVVACLVSYVLNEIEAEP